MRVFVAVPDSGLPAATDAALREVATTAGHEVLPDAPAAHAGVAASERDRFLTTVDRMMEADLLLADVSDPDAGVGWCVAWFLARGRLVVLTCSRGTRTKLPAMLAGNPSPWQRVALYDDEKQLRENLAKALAR